MTVQKKYIKTQEGAIASYNYTDISEGTGVVQFNGYVVNISGANAYKMTSATIPSAIIETTESSGNVTRNFDLTPFNLPKIISGTAVVTFSANLDTSGGGAGEIWFSIQFQKMVDTTATNISSEIFTQSISRGSAGTTSQSYAVSISLTQTHFKKGDYLRMVFKSYSTAALEKGTFGHDPENRAGTVLSSPSTYPTTMNILIPFRIDL